MTCTRRDNGDSPFSNWLRKREDLDSVRESLHVSDIDYSFLRYRTEVDKISTRRLKLMMQVELKTHGKEPDQHQLEHLFFLHQLLTHHRPLPTVNKIEGFTGKLELLSTLEPTIDGKLQNVSVWSMGQSILTLDGECPESSTSMKWQRFRSNGTLLSIPITTKELVGLLRFDLHPDTLKKFRFARHHTPHEGVVIREGGLFAFPERVTSTDYKTFQKKMKG